MFRVNIDPSEIVQKISGQTDQILNALRDQLSTLTQSTYSHIVEKARDELPDHQYRAYLGIDKNQKNLTAVRIDKNTWVIELDESAMDIEKGRQPVFMDWLLTKNPKAKTAKDGSKYAAIPIKIDSLSGPKFKSSSPGLQTMAKNAIKKEFKRLDIKIREIEKNSDGSPKIGVIRNIPVRQPGDAFTYPDFYSKARTQEMADLTGLKPHGGIFKLENLVITQRKNDKGKVVKEAVVFRTISSKHKAEGRWMAPAIKPFGGLQSGYDWAMSQVPEIIASIERAFSD